MTPVGVVYELKNESYLYVSRFTGEQNAIWIGQGETMADAVTEQTIRLDRADAMALIEILNKEVYTY